MLNFLTWSTAVRETLQWNPPKMQNSTVNNLFNSNDFIVLLPFGQIVQSQKFIKYLQNLIKVFATFSGILILKQSHVNLDPIIENSI